MTNVKAECAGASIYSPHLTPVEDNNKYHMWNVEINNSGTNGFVYEMCATDATQPCGMERRYYCSMDTLVDPHCIFAFIVTYRWRWCTFPTLAVFHDTNLGTVSQDTQRYKKFQFPIFQ